MSNLFLINIPTQSNPLTYANTMTNITINGTLAFSQTSNASVVPVYVPPGYLTVGSTVVYSVYDSNGTLIATK
jgi:hypothetical protein